MLIWKNYLALQVGTYLYLSFIPKIILGIYLSKEPEMCMHQGAFIIMVFMIGKKTCNPDSSGEFGGGWILIQPFNGLLFNFKYSFELSWWDTFVPWSVNRRKAIKVIFRIWFSEKCKLKTRKPYIKWEWLLLRREDY